MTQEKLHMVEISTGRTGEGYCRVLPMFGVMRLVKMALEGVNPPDSITITPLRDESGQRVCV